MKKNLIYLLFSGMLLCAALTACSDNDDLDSTSVVRPTTTEQNDLDRWLERNYVEAYNIQLKYRFEDIESSMGYYLTPASYKQSIAMAKLVRHMCLEAYDEITGSTDFIKAYFPKILYLVGSYAYKTNGSVVLGTAEAGAKITLYNLDNLNPKTVNAKTGYFKTIHHEFSHILNQTKPYPTDFTEISGPDYVQDQCFEIYKTTESALQKGFISPYASKADGEDFVELIALYVNRTAEEWEEMLTTAGDTGRPKIEAKFEIVYNYMKTSWEIDLNKLREIVLRRAEEAPNLDFDSLDDDGKKHLFNNLTWIAEDVKNHTYKPNIIFKGKEPIDFSCIELTQFSDYDAKNFDSISQVLEEYYASKNVYTRIRQKSVDLRKIVSTALDRNRKKYQLQEKQLKDTEKRDKYKVYGELIHTYGYGLEEGAKKLEALNYYTNEMITIPLDSQLDAKGNAQKYFDRYNKLKRTYEALTKLTEETKTEIEHLESISTALDIALTEDDLVQIKEELIEFGYIKRKKTDKKARIKSKPFHYRSSDGYDIYVGKNNYQNDELTFKFATGNDWWFHAKGMPGSHVIVKSNNEELPDRVFEEAGMLAGYYSKGREDEKVEIDYLQKKNVKKPNGAAPGFVVYYTNYSLTIHPDISGLTLVSD